MNADIKHPTTLTEAVRYFSDPETSLHFFASIRWPDGVRCPQCGSEKVSYLANQRRWQCHTKHPRRQFSAKVGTIFEDSALPLEQWMVAVWLEVNAKNSISSYELHRALGVTQKTAWFMLHRVRLALQNGSLVKFGGPGGPAVEVDETYIGGLARNMHKNRRDKVITSTGGVDKTPVMGLLERHSGGKCSQVRTKVLENRRSRSLHEVIHKNIEPGSQVFTDEHHGYAGLDPAFVHAVINHAQQYVDGIVHTNGLENFWALFKRCIKGTHVSVEPFHLFRYLDSECFRFNNRKVKDGDRFRMALGGATGKRLTYRALIGQDNPEGAQQSGNDEGNADFTS